MILNYSDSKSSYIDNNDTQKGTEIMRRQTIVIFRKKRNETNVNYTGIRQPKKELLKDNRDSHSRNERTILDATVETTVFIKEGRRLHQKSAERSSIIKDDRRNAPALYSRAKKASNCDLFVRNTARFLKYIKGPENIVADALSRLELAPSPKSESNPEVKECPTTRKLAEAFVAEPFPNDILTDDAFPRRLRDIQHHQHHDPVLQELVKKDPNYKISAFLGGGSRQTYGLITRTNLIAVPRKLEKRMNPDKSTESVRTTII